MRGEMWDKITSNPEAKGHVTTTPFASVLVALKVSFGTDKMILKEVRYLQPHTDSH